MQKSIMANDNRPILLASDHNGVALKQFIRINLKDSGFNVIDLGPFSGASVDYTDFARQMGEIIAHGDACYGILMCGTGVGMSIAANKIRSIRAALVHNIKTAPLTREHNDANVLCLGSWVNDDEANLEIVRVWLCTKFGEFRHVRRISKIEPSPAGTIVFANGCFDILHAGHIELLNFAKSLGDHLVVGINSDAAVNQLKGPGRPINFEEDRLKVIQSLRAVDEAIIFDSTTTFKIINHVRPNVIVKGGEWTADEVRERDMIPVWVDVKIFPMKLGYSSTTIINSIVSRCK